MSVLSLQNCACISFKNHFTKLIHEPILNYCKNRTDEHNHRLKVIASELKVFLKSNVPALFHNTLYNVIIVALEELYNTQISVVREKFPNCSELMLNVVQIILSIVLELHVTALNFDEISQFLWDPLYVKMHKLTRLERLTIQLQPTFTRVPDVKNVVSEALQFMPNLTSLKFDYFCTDHTIEIIAKHCKQLRNLNIKHSNGVTNNSVSHLISLEKLRQLEIQETNINMEGYIELLIGLPNLITVGQCYNMGKVLKKIDQKQKVNFSLNLSYIKCKDITTKELLLIEKICPRLMSLEIQCKDDADFRVLSGFSYLQELAISTTSFYKSGLDQFLEKVGSNLLILYLWNVKELNDNAIVNIGKHCPNLRKIIIQFCNFNNSKRSLHQMVSANIFSSVKYLELLGNMPTDVFRLLLSNCRNVETIVMVNMGKTLKCDSIKYALMRNPMISLREIYLDSTKNLKLATLEFWAANCKNLKCMYGLNRYGVFEELDELEEKFPYLQFGAMYFVPEAREHYRERGIIPD